MSCTVEKTQVNEVKLTITVPAAEFDAAMQKAYLKLRGQINIPGFRKGKAPRQLIEKMYSEAVFYEEAIDMVMPGAYDAAVEEMDLYPVDRPEVDVVEVGGGKDLVFTAVVTVKPEVTLGQYKGIEVAKPEYNVTDDQVDAELARAQDRVARWNVVEDRPVQQGDRIMLDYAGTVDGVAFDGGTAQNQPLEIGSGRFIPGFEDQLVGVALGEEKDVVVTFPDPYQSEELAGKEAVFHCKVNEIKAKEVPALDDDFAKDVSEYDTLEAYKASIRENLEKAAQERAQNELETKLLEAAVAASQLEVPECMIRRQQDYMIQEMQYRMSFQGIRMEDYLKMTGMTMDQLREENREEALRRVKNQLVLEAIQKAEGVEATEEDIDAEIGKMATETRTLEDLKKDMRPEDIDYMRGKVLTEKTLKILVDSAVLQ